MTDTDHRTRNSRGLAGTLANLIDQAETSGDQQYHPTYLRGGLHVAVMLNKKFNLLLAREGREPSATEWQTVVDYLPEAYKPAQPIEPRRYISLATGRHCLAATWDYQHRML